MEQSYLEKGLAKLPLKSLQTLRGLGQTDSVIDKGDVIGLLLGAIAGFIIAKKWPGSIVKYVGVIVGAEAGVIISQVIKSYRSGDTETLTRPKSSYIGTEDFIEADYRMVR